MQHIRVLLLEHHLPRIVGHGVELAADGVVPHLPVRARKHGVGAGDGAELELRVGRERLGGQNRMSGGFLVRIVLPLDEADVSKVRNASQVYSVAQQSLPLPSLPLSGEELLTITDGINSLFIFSEWAEFLGLNGFSLAASHVQNGEDGPGQALLDLPLIRTVRGLDSWSWSQSCLRLRGRHLQFLGRLIQVKAENGLFK